MTIALHYAITDSPTALTDLGPQSAVMALFQQWQTLTQILRGDMPLTETQLELGGEMRCRIKDQMFATPSVTAQDHLAKIIASTAWGDWEMGDDGSTAFWSEAQALMDAQPW